MELRGGEGSARARRDTPREQLLARYGYFAMKIYQLLLLCLSLELLLWPSGISLGFWCRAWGWCDSPAWTAEETSDVHLCSTWEIQKGKGIVKAQLFISIQTTICYVPNQRVSLGTDAGEWCTVRWPKYAANHHFNSKILPLREI